MMADKKIEFNPREVFLDSKYTSVKTFLGFELSEPNPVLDAWIECARNDFNSIYQRIYGACRRSINVKVLAEMEIRELNKFFECGKSLSMAVNIEEHIFRSSEPIFKVKLSSEVIFNHYLMLLRGNFDTFLTKGHLDTLSTGQVNLEPENLSDKQNIKWWATARVQALMWARDYLEDLIKEGKEKELLNQPEGFQVKNPNETIPALYNLLIKNSLIEDEGEAKFKIVFQDGGGVIKWKKGGNLLIYLINEMKTQKIIVSNSFIKLASGLFIDKNGNQFKYTSLNTSNNRNKDTPPKLANNIDDIISSLKGLGLNLS